MPPRSFEINVAVTGLERAAREFSNGARQMRQATQQFQDPERMLQQAARSGAIGRRQARAALSSAERELESFLGGGRAGDVRAARGADRQSRFETFIRSTRFGVGGTGILGRISPLAGRAADLMGAPVGATAVATGALIAFAEAVRHGTGVLQDFAIQGRLTGGTAGQVGGLAAFGIGPGEAAGRAGAFRGLAASDPFARSLMAQRGINVLPRPFGSTNEAQLLLEGIRILEQETNAEERLRKARILGLESELAIVEASPGVRRSLQQTAEELAKLADPRTSQAARDLNAQQKQLQLQWDLLTTQLAQAFLPVANRVLGALTGKGPAEKAIEALQRGDIRGFLFGTPDDPRTGETEDTKALREIASNTRGILRQNSGATPAGFGRGTAAWKAGAISERQWGEAIRRGATAL